MATRVPGRGYWHAHQTDVFVASREDHLHLVHHEAGRRRDPGHIRLDDVAVPRDQIVFEVGRDLRYWLTHVLEGEVTKLVRVKGVARHCFS
ncbi:hypothetical protein MSZK_14410 [Mycobacterium sp. shizuoka-1]|nr:hypothetical protein [Mycobacterium sp. shizuoka-1]GAY14715.1 hypothetical protein MSZK_14410 [Mycobacterium sp. shizuoka-1]